MIVPEMSWIVREIISLLGIALKKDCLNFLGGFSPVDKTEGKEKTEEKETKTYNST